MTDKRHCSGLSKGWWWLLMLAGLPLLYFLMLSSKWKPIEQDIQTRTSEKLSSLGIQQITVETNERGRDVLLNGAVSTEAEKNQIIQTAKAVEGVRIIEDNIEVVTLSSPDFSFVSNANKVTLTGTMPSQKSIDNLLNATINIYGIDNVENKLSIGKYIDSPSWLSNIIPFLSDLKQVKNAELQVSDNKHKVSGIVRSEDQKSSLFSTFTSLFGDKATEQLIIHPLKKPTLQANFNNGKVILRGAVGSQEKINEIYNKVTENVGKDNVINKLIQNNDYANTNGIINLTGEATNKNSYNLISSAIQKSGETIGFHFENKLTLNAQEAIAVVEAEHMAREKATAEKTKAERMAREKAKAELMAREKATAEKTKAERMAREKAVAEKAKAERMAREKAIAEKAKAERMAREKATAEKTKAERMAREKAIAEKTKAERMAREKAAAEKAKAERMAKEKAAAKKAKAKRIAEAKAEAEIKAAEEEFAKQLAKQKTIAMQACQSKLNQAMSGKAILFETNKANIKRASFPLLNHIVSVIKACRANVTNTRIKISGHTDSRGSDAYNLKLSQRRASAVKTYLANKGIEKSIITSKGYGETQPVASNKTPKGRSQNRRITFSVR